MAYFVYVSLQGDDKILRFGMDPTNGSLEPEDELVVPGGPAPMTLDPTRRFLYAARRGDREVSSFAVEQRTGSLTLIGTLSLPSDPPFLATDRRGKFLLSSYYQAGHVAVHPIDGNGAAAGQPIEWIETATGAHSIQTDPSNQFVFVPHIADRGPNEIRQYRFDPETGHLTPSSPAVAVPPGPLGPRHFCFHPNLDMLYFCNEQGCSVTSYELDSTGGTLSPVATVSTLPDGFEGRNTCAEIRISPSGRFLYASNRGHNSIACFVVDPDSGLPTRTACQPTESVPRAFSLDPEGRYLFAAGQESGRLASYVIEAETGALRALKVYPVGVRPMWVLTARLGD